MRARELIAKKRLRARYQVTAQDSFDSRFDAFWDVLCRHSQHMLWSPRTREFLDWRFAGQLSRNHAWLFTIPHGSSLLAYALFARVPATIPGMSRARLVDFQSVSDLHGTLASLLAAARDRAAAENVHVLESIGFSTEKRRLISQLTPYRRTLSSWRYFYKTSNPELAAQLSDPACWDCCSFDGDAWL
jgi:hypothetical protein